MNQQPCYQWDGTTLKLIDSELDLNIEMAFQPKMLSDVESHLESGWHLAEVFGSSPECMEKRVMHHRSLEGEAVRFRKDGSLLGRCFYLHNQLHGPSLTFFKEGLLASESWFIEGVQQGQVLEFYPSGKLYAHLKFKNGRRHLEQLYFWENGVIQTRLIYQERRLIKAAMYDREGREREQAPILETHEYWKEDEIAKFVEG